MVETTESWDDGASRYDRSVVMAGHPNLTTSTTAPHASPSPFYARLDGQDHNLFFLHLFQSETAYYLRWCFVAVGGLGFLANLLTLIVLSVSAQLFRPISDFRDLLINQCIADMMTSLVVLMQSSVSVPEVEDPLGREFLCRFWSNRLLLLVCLLASTYSLGLVSLERYCDNFQSTNPRVRFNRKTSLIANSTVWIFSTCWYNFTQSTTKVVGGVCYPFRFWKNRSSLYGYLSSHVLVHLVVPLGVVIFCYSSMWLSHSRRVTPAVDVIRVPLERASLVYTRKNLLKIFSGLSATFGVALIWMQLNFMLLLADFSWDININQYRASLLLLVSIIALKPIVCLAKIYQLGTGLKRLVFCDRRTWTQEEQSMDLTTLKWGRKTSLGEKLWTPHYKTDDAA